MEPGLDQRSVWPPSLCDHPKVPISLPCGTQRLSGERVEGSRRGPVAVSRGGSCVYSTLHDTGREEELIVWVGKWGGALERLKRINASHDIEPDPGGLGRGCSRQRKSILSRRSSL